MSWLKDELEHLLSHPWDIGSTVSDIASHYAGIAAQEAKAAAAKAAQVATDDILGKLVSPVQTLQKYVTGTEQAVKTLADTAVSGLKDAGGSVLHASKGAIGDVTGQAGAIGDRIAAASKSSLLEVSSVAGKLEALPSLSLSTLTVVADKLGAEIASIETKQVSALYGVFKGSSAKDYAAQLGTTLNAISAETGTISRTFKIPVSGLEAELVAKLADVLGALPDEGAQLLAGIVPLEELESALGVLKQIATVGTMIKVDAKALIVTSASLRAISILLDAAAKIVPLTVGVEEETGVGAEEEGGAGLAAGVRGGAEGRVGEEGNLGGGVTVVSVGKWVCYGLSLVILGVALLFDQLQQYAVTKMEVPA